MPTYKIADLVMNFDPVLKSIASLAEPYRIADSDHADVVAFVTPEDIKNEEKYLQGITPNEAAYTAVYRKICTQILNYNAFVFHSSAIVLDGNAYLFTALSGTGKSTHTSLWLEYFKDRAFIINDDKPIVRYVDGQYRVYGTPWCGKHGINKNTSAPIKGVAFLHRGKENSIKIKNISDVLVPLLNQAYRPKEDLDYSNKFFDEIERFINSVNFYDLYCNISTEAVEVAYNGMK